MTERRQTEFRPGDIVRAFAARHRWPIAERSILVEGETDRRYFMLAARLYEEECGRRLLGNDVAVFPTGIGDEGGAFGLQRHFHPLRSVMEIDLTPEGRVVFHAIALFDNDMNGKKGFNALTGQHLNYRRWRDVFLLHRSFPMTTRDPVQVEKLVVAGNEDFKMMDCEIEDLVNESVVDAYAQQNPRAFIRPPSRVGTGIHLSFVKGEKGQFCSFVERYAICDDVRAIIEILKALRYFLGLKPDGS